MRSGRGRAIGGGVAGGVLAGAAVGGLEALAVWMHTHGAGELPAIAWALVAYGAVGGLAGLGAGVLGALVGAEGFALALPAVAASLGFVVGRFRVVRDVFLEQLPHGPLALGVQVVALAGVVAIAVAACRALRGAEERRRVFTRPGIVVIGIVVAASVWVAAARPSATRPGSPVSPGGTPPAAAPNVILIMVDTLRADRLSCYGSAETRTPHVDGLAVDGVRYVSAFAQSSWTRPSVATILSGLYPSSHGAVHKADRLPDRVQTLAELLQQAGYRTVGFPNNANVTEAFNFQQGFDEYHYLAPDLFFWASEPAARLTLYSTLRLVRERFLARRVHVRHYYQPAEAVGDAVERWLAGGGAERPFFLFLHYMDPHDPYFVHPFDGRGVARVADPNPPPERAAEYRRLYDGEVEYLDTHLGVLFDDLRARGLYDTSLIILTSDHGEEFHEHGGWWHGTTLYDEQLRVPLIVKPARARGLRRVVDGLATSLDIVPTVLAALGLPSPSSLQGRALAVDGAGDGREHVFAESDLEGNVLQSVRTREWKLITANPGNPRGLAPEELFHVGQDPTERRELLAASPAEGERMRAMLGRSVLEARTLAGASEQGGMDAATQERLRALGYVH